MMKKIIIFLLHGLRYVSFLAPFFVFAWLFEQYFALDGTLVIPYSFTRENTRAPQLITEFGPSDRLLRPEKRLLDGVSYRRLHAEPVYFRVTMPRLYERVRVDLTYENRAQPLFEIGLARGDKEQFSFDFRSLQNTFIDRSLAGKIHLGFKVTDAKQQLHLLQREPVFANVETFLQQLPAHPEYRVALYNTSISPGVRLPDYTATSSRFEINPTLRGRHEFFTYIKNETFDVRFTWQDINRKVGSDPVRIQLWSADTLVSEKLYEDDTILEASGAVSEKHQGGLLLAGLSEGTYKIIFDASDDIIIREISTTQHRFVVSQRLYLVDAVDLASQLSDLSLRPTELVTNISSLSARTSHDTGLQTVNIHGIPFAITARGRLHEWSDELFALPEIRSITVPLNDVEFFGNGFFAFTRESFFDPNGSVERLMPNIDFENTDFLLYADYTTPVQIGSWIHATAQYDIRKDHLQENNSLYFILSAPGISKISTDVLIRNLTITLEKEPFSWRDIFRRF